MVQLLLHSIKAIIVKLPLAGPLTPLRTLVFKRHKEDSKRLGLCKIGGFPIWKGIDPNLQLSSDSCFLTFNVIYDTKLFTRLSLTSESYFIEHSVWILVGLLIRDI